DRVRVLGEPARAERAGRAEQNVARADGPAGGTQGDGNGDTGWRREPRAPSCRAAESRIPKPESGQRQEGSSEEAGAGRQRGPGDARSVSGRNSRRRGNVKVRSKKLEVRS